MSAVLSPHVFLIDDDESLCDLLSLMLAQKGFKPTAFSDLATVESANPKESPLLILLDWRLGETDGLKGIEPLRKKFPNSSVVLMTGSPSVELAVSAIRLGAFDFLAKPIEEARLTMILAKAAEHHRLLSLVDDLEEGGRDRAGFEEMIGTSPQIRTIYHIIRNVAPTDVNVMISGESGTGKELVARAIHRRSGVKGPFVAVNMASLPRELVESLLFGHERGSFTGAEKQRLGACEEASNGTLFLDEIGEMPLELQAKLLRFLQERVFRRVGGSEDIPLTARIICATNRDPLAEVKAGRLRSDLYYRLNVVPIVLPPLRDRPGDVGLIALHVLRQISERHGKNFTEFAPDVLQKLSRQQWEGNVRQLVHLIERVVVLNDGKIVTNAMLPHEMDSVTIENSTGEPRSAEITNGTALETEILPLAVVERQAIERALSRFPDSAAEAARHLKISQATIYRKMKEYGLLTK